MTYDPLERVCIAFHSKWQRWAPIYGQEHSDRSWQDMPDSYRKLLKQVVRHMLDDGDLSLNCW